MENLIPIFAIFFVIGVPVMSIATHFVLRPLVRDIVGALRGGSRQELDGLRAQITELHEDFARHENQLHVLTEAEAFRRQLEARRNDQATG